MAKSLLERLTDLALAALGLDFTLPSSDIESALKQCNGGAGGDVCSKECWPMRSFCDAGVCSYVEITD